MYVSKCQTQNIRKEYKNYFTVLVDNYFYINEISAISTQYNPKLKKAICKLYWREAVLTCMCTYNVCAAMQANSWDF